MVQDEIRALSGVIPSFIKKAINDEPPIIDGSGEQTRDFTFVDDVVHANLLALKSRSVRGRSVKTSQTEALFR